MADVISLEWEGQRYDVDLMSVTAREWRQIKQHTGLKQGAFIRSFMSLDELDADVITSLLWLGKRRAGNALAAFEDDIPTMQIMQSIQLPTPDEDAEGGDPKAEGSEPTST